MAKVKFGMFMTDARGKVGGQVFSKNRGGAYVRTKVTPSNGQTSRQTFIRQLLSSISIAWATLTAQARSGFNAAVNDWSTTDIFGDSRNPSGKTLFTKLNMNLANSLQTQITSVPDKVAVPALGNFSITADLSDLAIDVLAADVVLGSKILVNATAPLSNGIYFYKGRFRQIAVVDSGAILTTDLWAAYVAKFGVPSLNDNIAFELKRVMPNGQAGLAQTVKVLIQA